MPNKFFRSKPNHTVTFDIDDSGIIENGHIRSRRVDSENLTRNTVTLTDDSILSVSKPIPKGEEPVVLHKVAFGLGAWTGFSGT